MAKMLDPLNPTPLVGDGTAGESIQPEEGVIRPPIPVGPRGQECVGDRVIRYLWPQPSPGIGKHPRIVQIEEFGELLLKFGVGVGVGVVHCPL